jgi:hypothetical protein
VMTQVDHGLTRVNVLDSVIITNDATQKPGASQCSHRGYWVALMRNK